MNTSQLSNRVARTLVGNVPIVNVLTATVIAAGPLTKQPGTLPYRIVLVNWGCKLTVHRQTFDIRNISDSDLATACSKAESELTSGQYFLPSELVKATVAFGERLKDDAENHYESVYRDLNTVGASL